MYADDENESSDLQKSATTHSGMTLSVKAIALIVLALSLISAGLIFDCLRRRRRKQRKRTKSVEEEQMRWFEKQRAQLASPPVKKTSAVNLTCASVPVATFRGRNGGNMKLPGRLPVVEFDSTDLDDCVFPDNISEMSVDSEEIQSQKMPIKKLSIALDIRNSGVEVEVSASDVSLELDNVETTVEYVSDM